MILNYIRLSFRNLLRDSVYSVINIGGLALGIAASIMLMLWVQQELSYDTFHSKGDRIYKVNAKFENNGTILTWPVTPAPIAVFGKQSIPAIEEAVRISDYYGTALFTYGNKKIVEDRPKAYVDNNFFNVFDVRLLKGNSENPFPDTRSVILSSSVAKKVFNTEDAVGKVFKLNDKDDYTVVGIMEDFPKNSSLQYAILFPFEILIKEYNANEYWKTLESDWGNYNYQTFLLLNDGASADSVAQQLTDIHHKNQKESESLTYITQPLAKLHLYGADLSEEGIQTVRIFFIIALAILLIACINYINLATARATKRAKEVGVRKTVGADRARLIVQFLSESAIISVLALLLSLVLIQLAIPFYNALSGKMLSFTLTDTTVASLVVGSLLLTWLISGLYPALVLSAFKPMEVIRGKLTISGGNSTFRKILVVTQFSLSIVIIICTLVVGKQLDFIQSKKLGFNKENTFTFGLRGKMYKDFKTIRNELLKNPAIEQISIANQNVLTIENTTGDTNWDGKQEGQEFMVHGMSIDEHFMQGMGMEIVQGEGFTGAISDSAKYILNETAVREAGIEDPIGKSFTLWGTKGTIAGVVKDFHHRSIRKKIEPTVFLYRPDWLWLVYVKTNGMQNQEAVAAAQSIWKQYNPAYPFEYKFLDDAYDNMYDNEQRMGKLFTGFSAIAICISCLGLFGLATFTAAQRVKEIGIRKVMGASISQIIILLSKDFLILVIVAFAIAAPASWYMMEKWLGDFAYRTAIPWQAFTVAGVVVVALALVTMSFQTIKAALGNPVDSLRSE
ncbi:ABC transporter permease [Ohtaekwangia koreensis]|uniref:Duplicated orphan permease n=1 Tax=Ohtaekwangia koreensis TaxID=688867 RepID=A0A1T5MPM6_9BACT|nr:ABC transporter permease [Ohtaekwangia koreensis]SKC89848.1 duplicated orphan permease [Ohtaekwangia koreensis]